jgi:hypothetical protein
VSSEFYTSFPITMAMFIKREDKNTFELRFKEAIKVEKGMLSLKGNTGLENEKDASYNKNKVPQVKAPSDKKDQDSMDM